MLIIELSPLFIVEHDLEAGQLCCRPAEATAVARRIIHAVAQQEAVLLDMSDDEECLADLQREIAELIVALTWVECQQPG